VHLNEKAITNMSRLFDVQKNCHVKFDSKRDNCFHAIKPNGEVPLFKPSQSGLCHHDCRDRAITMLNTEEENKSRYSKRQHAEAKTARNGQNAMGNCSTSDFRGIMRAGMVDNCPMAADAVDNAEDILVLTCPR